MFEKINIKGPAYFVIGLISILLLPKVFQQGIFFDGLIYSSVSNNMANGQGSFWDPSYSQTIWLHFHEHPPFALGLQSIFIKVFNGAFFAEKLYSLLMGIVSIIFITKIWKSSFKEKAIQSLWWLPLFLWILTPKVFWVINNNMLEGTLMAMTLGSIYFSLKGIRTKKHHFFFVAGLFLIFASLTKGPVGLFPLAFVPFYFLIFKNDFKIKPALKASLLVLGSFIVLLGLLFLIFPESHVFIENYFNGQVVSSIQGKQRVGSRLNFLKDIIMELLPMLIVSLIFIGIRYRSVRTNLKTHGKTALLFFAVGCSAIIPLFISPKLSQFYIVPGIPYLAIGFATLIAPEMASLMEKMKINSITSKAFTYIGTAMILFALVFAVIKAGKVDRDHDIHHDMELVSEVVENGSIISISGHMKEDWTTISYFQRFHQISFDLKNDSLNYILLLNTQKIPEGYESLNLDLQKYKLVVSRK